MKERARPWPLLVRRATADDVPAILEFASGTWDGWDYIPHALPVWLQAPDGVVLVGVPGEAARDATGEALAAARPIAVARVAITGPGEAWLEGIRVHPGVRGMNVATDLQVAELHWARALGASVVRYATGQQNEGSHRLGARHGFEVLTSLRTYWSSEGGDDEGADEENAFDEHARQEATRKRRAALDLLAGSGLVALSDRVDGGRLWSRLADDATFRQAGRLYELRAWALQELTRERFARHLAAGEVLLSDGPAWALAILPAEALPAEDASLHLGLIVGEGRSAIELAARVREATGGSIRFRLPDQEPPLPGIAADDMQAAGFAAREWTLHILARPLDDGHPPPPVETASLVLHDLDRSATEI